MSINNGVATIEYSATNGDMGKANIDCDELKKSATVKEKDQKTVGKNKAAKLIPTSRSSGKKGKET